MRCSDATIYGYNVLWGRQRILRTIHGRVGHARSGRHNEQVQAAATNVAPNACMPSREMGLSDGNDLAKPRIRTSLRVLIGRGLLQPQFRRCLF